eukprot:Gb_02642 [translate_table: standard]
MSTSGRRKSLTEEKENTASNGNNNNNNNVARNRYSPVNVTPGSSGAKKRLIPATQWRANTPAAKVSSSERKPLKDIQTPIIDPSLKNSEEKKKHGDLAEKIPGSNPDGFKRRLNGIGSIAKGFINREKPAVRRSLSSNASLEAPKGCFGFLHSAKPVSKTARKCSPTTIARPVVSRGSGERIRTCDGEDLNPKEGDGRTAALVPKGRSSSLPRSNSEGSGTMARRNGGSSWSRDRTLRSSNGLKNSGTRSLKNSGEIMVKGSRDRSLKGSGSLKSSGEISVKGSRDRTVKSSGECGLKDSREKSLRNSGSCQTPKKLSDRKVTRTGSLRRNPSQNGMKKNCGLDNLTLERNADRNSGSEKGVVNKIEDQVLKPRSAEQKNGSISSLKCTSSPLRRAPDIKANLPAIGSPRVMRTLAIQRIQTTPSHKVYSNPCQATPAHKLIIKEGDFTPAHRLIGRYEDFSPANKFIAMDGKFTPANKLIETNGDCTPAHTMGGHDGDSTPAPNMIGGEGEFTPAHNAMHTTPEQRTQVTPPVQPSISPEIHSQISDELEDAHRCFGAGHVMAPVLGKIRDRRKCRPRGILTVGEAKPLPVDENYRRFSLIPMPAVASVRWMSPGEAKNGISPPNPQAIPSEFTQGTPSSGFSSKTLKLQGTPSCFSSNFENFHATPPGFTPETLKFQASQATLSSGFNSKLPSQCWYSPDISPQCVHPRSSPSAMLSPRSPQHGNISPQCGNSQGAPSGFNPDVTSQGSACPDIFRLCKLKTSPVEGNSCRQELQMPISSSQDLAKLRISWREGLMSRIFELSELDCCEWISEGEGERKEDEVQFISGENHLLDTGDNMKLEYPGPFGSFEYMCEPNADRQDLSPLLASCLNQDKALSESLVQSCISSTSRAAGAESIETEGVMTSGDLDWTSCYKNQLFEQTTQGST